MLNPYDHCAAWCVPLTRSPLCLPQRVCVGDGCCENDCQWGRVHYNRVPTAQGKQGKWQKEFPVRENTWNFEILSKHREFCLNTGKTGNFVSSSCKCSDSKSKGHCDSCRKKNIFFLEAV